MKKLFVSSIAILIAFVAFSSCVARADTTQQAWNESGVTGNGTFDTIDLFIQTQGVVFSNPGLSSVWTNTNVSPTFAFATGTATSSLDFSSYFSGNTSTTFVVDFYALLGNTVVDSAKMTYPVSDQPYSWQIGSLATSFAQENTSATPEPSSLIMLGTGLLAGAGFLFKRRSMIVA